MSDTLIKLPKLDLQNARVWLSGSIPEPDDETPDVQAIFEEWKGAEVTVTEKTGDEKSDRDPSLAIMREYMAAACTAFVAIGGRWWSTMPGRAGIPKEFEAAKMAGVPCFILGGFGGVSQTLIDENPEWLVDLNNGLTNEQNIELSEGTNFVLAAGKIASQIHLLSERGNDIGFSGMAEM